jgi:hypothetical protein
MADKLKTIIAHTNEFMKHQYPEDWHIIKHFATTIKNPFVLWSYYKKILLALRVPIIEEPLDKKIYIDDILTDNSLTQGEKDSDIDFRKEYHKEATIWFHRAQFGEAVDISSATMRKINDNTKTLCDFGYNDMHELKNSEIKKIKVVKKFHNLQSDNSIIKLECKFLEKQSCKRFEPVGSIPQNQQAQVYLPHTQLKKILQMQGRNNPLAFLLLDLSEAIIRYQSCAIAEALRFRSKLTICRLGSKIDELLDESRQSREEARENTNRIVGRLDIVSNQLDIKKEVVSNTETKGVIIVQYLDESKYNLNNGEFLIYIHGGKQSYWHNYHEDAERYNVLYCFNAISDHDKAIRVVKRDLHLTTIPLKRHLFKMDQDTLDAVGNWYSIWETKCDH